MNEKLRVFLLGLLIWVVPFIMAVLVWDPVGDVPRIGQGWFNALMTVSWAVVYSIALTIYFRNEKKPTTDKGLKVGVSWYLTLVVLDLVFIVGLFGTPLSEYAPLFLTQTPNIFITAAVATLLGRRRGRQ